MSTYRLKQELSFDELMPAVLLAQTLLGQYVDANTAAKCTLHLLEAILANPADVVRFAREAERLGPEKVSKRLLEFYN